MDEKTTRILVYGLSSDKMGGIEMYLLNMNQFMPDNIKFDYVIEGSEENGSIHSKRVAEYGGQIYYVAAKKNMVGNTRDWFRLLREKKKEADTAKVVYFNMYSLSWIVPVLVSRLCGYEVIVHAHNNNLHNCGAVLKGLHRFNRGLLKHMRIRRFTNSSLSAEFFFGNKPAEMIYNAIDTERFAFNEEKRKQIREQERLDGKHVYGFAGRMAYQKNPLFLMDIFNEIQKEDTSAAFLVCGDGDLMEETQKKAKEYGLDIRFAGAIENVEDYYQAMDVFVLPSRFEGLGIVLIEAQTAGLPCITSKDVVPQDAKVTELLDYISLDSGAEAWGEACVKKCLKTRERKEYATMISKGPFEIRKEAIRLAYMLTPNTGGVILCSQNYILTWISWHECFYANISMEVYA